MIRDIKIEVHNEAVEEAPKQFDISFFLKFRKTPVHLWLGTDDSEKEILKAILDFVGKLLFLSE